MFLGRQSSLARITAACATSITNSTANSAAVVPAMSRRRRLSGPVQGRVGFIGLGNMGSFMVANLVKAGHQVIIFDVDSSKTRTLAAETGATSASSLKEVAQTSTSIITMLPDTPNVEDVFLGNPEHPWEEIEPDLSSSGTAGRARAGSTEAKRGLLDLVEAGTLVVDSSTIDPLASRRINAIAKSKGVTMLDAPVSGGVPAAADATLTFIVGGTEEGMKRARPLLKSMGTKAVHCGEAGTGCTAKVCNNLSLAVSMVGVAEAMSLGSKMGMDPKLCGAVQSKVLASVLNSSTARCWSSEAYNPSPGVMESVPSSRGFQGGFAAALMEKDLYLALQAARESSQSLPMGAHAHQLYSLLCREGSAHKDFSSIYEFISR